MTDDLGNTDTLNTLPPNPRPTAADIAAAVAEAAADAMNHAMMDAQAWADAQTVVARAKSRAGHGMTAYSPTDAQAVRNIAGVLRTVQRADSTVTEDDFERKSAAKDVACGEAIARAMAQIKTEADQGS